MMFYDIYLIPCLDNTALCAYTVLQFRLITVLSGKDCVRRALKYGMSGDVACVEQ